MKPWILQLEKVIATFPGVFGLREFEGEFRIAPPIGKGGSSYVNDIGEPVLYVQRRSWLPNQRPIEDWRDFAKGDERQLRREMVSIVHRSNCTCRDCVKADYHEATAVPSAPIYVDPTNGTDAADGRTVATAVKSARAVKRLLKSSPGEKR